MALPDTTDQHELTIWVAGGDDAELTAMAFCLLALRDLDANAAARVASYVAERHPFTGEASHGAS